MVRLLSLALFFALAFAGCGGSKAPTPTKDAMSAETKTMIGQFVDKARKKQVGAAELAVLLETLEGRAKEFGEGHKQVLEAAKGLQSAYGKSESEVEQRIEELSQAASKL